MNKKDKDFTKQSTQSGAIINDATRGLSEEEVQESLEELNNVVQATGATGDTFKVLDEY